MQSVRDMRNQSFDFQCQHKWRTLYRWGSPISPMVHRCATSCISRFPWTNAWKKKFPTKETTGEPAQGILQQSNSQNASCIVIHSCNPSTAKTIKNLFQSREGIGQLGFMFWTLIEKGRTWVEYVVWMRFARELGQDMQPSSFRSILSCVSQV